MRQAVDPLSVNYEPLQLNSCLKLSLFDSVCARSRDACCESTYEHDEAQPSHAELTHTGEGRVTLLDLSRTHLWKPLLHSVAAGSLKPSEHELVAQAYRHNFRFRFGEMVGVDRNRKLVMMAATYDEDNRLITRPGQRPRTPVERRSANHRKRAWLHWDAQAHWTASRLQKHLTSNSCPPSD